MVSSPVHNISSFLKNKPPLVIFLLCMVTLAVSSFYYAFEIEKDSPTLDSNKKHDWRSMLKHFNQLDSCINFSTWNDKVNIRVEKENFKTGVEVTAKVTVDDVNSLRPFTHIYGVLSLQGWHSTTCEHSDQQPKNVHISFIVPSLPNTLNGSIELCATIKGPAQFLPLLKTEKCHSSNSQNDQNKKSDKGFLITRLSKLGDQQFCTDGKEAKLYFDLDQSEVLNYLSDDVRTQIYIHLMWCSYFFVFIVFCILMYAILKKSEYLERKEQSERLL